MKGFNWNTGGEKSDRILRYQKNVYGFVRTSCLNVDFEKYFPGFGLRCALDDFENGGHGRRVRISKKEKMCILLEHGLEVDLGPQLQHDILQGVSDEERAQIAKN